VPFAVIKRHESFGISAYRIACLSDLPVRSTLADKVFTLNLADVIRIVSTSSQISLSYKPLSKRPG
jgi:hypothetical protein